jgi:cobalt-zinc-cadmium efflux system protein
VNGHAEHGPASAGADRRRLALVLVVGSAITLVEVVSGVIAHSLVLLADAAHYFTDLFSLALALVAVTWAVRPADEQHSFGHGRAEVLAAFVNAVVLWVIVALLGAEAYLRLRSPVAVEGPIVLVVGGFTLAANLALARFLRTSDRSRMNVRAAYLHVLSDVLGSAAAVAAGALIYLWRIELADPIASLLVAALVAVFAYRLSRESVNILLEGTPAHLDPSEVERTLRTVPSVRSVHDLHLWTLGSGAESMSVHVVLQEPPRDDRVAHEIDRLVRERFRIRHSTIQVEAPDCPCGVAAH